jgi:hypothetical protein
MTKSKNEGLLCCVNKFIATLVPIKSDNRKPNNKREIMSNDVNKGMTENENIAGSGHIATSLSLLSASSVTMTYKRGH